MSSKGIGWPVVALAAIVAGAFVGIFALIPEGEAASRSAMLSVVTVVSSGVVTIFLGRKIGGVQEKLESVEKMVNGNTSRMIDKLPEPDRAVERLRHNLENSGDHPREGSL